MSKVWEWIKIVFLIICCIAALAIISPHTSAADITANDLIALNTTNLSEVIVTGITDIINPQPDVSVNVPYIQQGDTVYLDTTVDISGVVPPYPQLAYWDGFDMYDSAPTYNITLPDSKKGYYHFYVDPKIFEHRTGRWYKYNGEFEKQGNNLAFVVAPYRYKNATLTYPNGTVVNTTEKLNQENYTQKVIVPEPLLPERHMSDYVVARGDSIEWPAGEYHLWVFGRLDGIYDHVYGNISKEEVNTLEPGRYTVVVNTAGNNTLYEARNISNVLYPALYGRKPIDIHGMSAPVVFEKFKEMLNGTDDGAYEYSMDVDAPYITIKQATEIYKNGTSALDVRGYTNVAPGTVITVTLDEKNTYYKDIWKQSASTVAVRTSPGNLSYYSAVVPIDYNDLAADARNHTLTAKTAIGGEIQKDFKISIMPVDSYRPNATLKYIEDRNPFVPTPTPEVRTVVVTQTIKVVERITIPVTPTNEQVKAEQDAVITDKIFLALFVIFGALLIGAMLWYMYSVYKRGRRKDG